MLIRSEPPTVIEMLLGFIAGILNKYIGAYFEDIDVSQLTGSIFGGGISLNNIHLRPNILESLGIPFHVVGGKCGKLEVKYSLTRLYSEPIVVILKDLHLLIIPARGVAYNPEAEEESRQAEKMRQLDIFESVKHHIILTQQQKSNKTKTRKIEAEDEEEASVLADIANSVANVPQEATYFDMWVMQVLRNIQFYLEGVHVRFEDNVTKPLEPFAFGIFLQSLQVHTTDSNWISQYVKDYVPETSYKVVKINDLLLYWNPSPAPLYKDEIDKEELYERLAATPKNKHRLFNMIFEPLTTDLKVQITPFPDTIRDPFSKPKLLIESSLNEFKVNISDKQFKDIIPFLETLDSLTKSLKYRKYRVDLHGLPYQGYYKEWWNFAYECVLDDIQRRRNNFRWERIRAHRHKCKSYLKAYYQKKVENRSTLALDLTISQLEKDLDLFMLIMLRQQVELIISRQKEPAAASAEGYMPWVLSWFTVPYWFPPVITVDTCAANNPVTPKPSDSKGHIFSVTQLTRNEKEMIHAAIGFATNNDIVSYPNDYVGMEACVLLNQLRARIYRSKGLFFETVLEGVLDKVSFVLRCRPVDQGLGVELKMGRVEVYGGDFPKDGSSTDLESPPPLITTANPNAIEYFLKFAYEKNPLNSDVDQKVSLEGLALQFTFLADAIERIVECFSVPPKQNFPKRGNILASRVLKRVMQFRNAPTTRLLRMMENKGKIELNICLLAPYIVIPQDSTTKGKANFVVVNLGEINLVGTLVGGTLCENGTCSTFL